MGVEPIRSGALVSIDLARAFAALSVFVYHYGIGAVIARETGWPGAGLLAWPGANIAVPLFFVLSGYCIHQSEKRRLKDSGTFSTAAYARRRFWRIYPVYAAALLLSVAINLAHGKKDPAWDIAVHALMLQSFSAHSFNSINLVLWTIAVECCLYAIYPFWLKLRLSRGLGTAIAVAVAVTLMSWTITALFCYPYGDAERLFFTNVWCGWIAGAAFSEAMEARPAWFRSLFWWAMGAMLWIATIAWRPDSASWGKLQVLDAPLLMILSVWLLCGLVIAERGIRRIAGAARWIIAALALIGAASYSLYLLHIPLIELRNLIQTVFQPGPWRLGFQGLWFFIALWLCWLSYRYVERPFMALGSRQAAPRRKPA